MLARKYDSNAWEVEQYEEVVRPERVSSVNNDPYRLVRGHFMLFALLVLSTYMASVVLSEVMVTSGSQLVSMRREETTLINQNNKLKIEVEQLKGPERIIGLAEQNLGMSVARSNIYLKSLAEKAGSGASLTVASR